MDEKQKVDHVAKMLENIQPRTIQVKDAELAADILLVPVGMKAESVAKYIDEYRERPKRRSGIERADRLQAFIDLTNRFKSQSSVIFAKGEITDRSMAASLTAILNYHPANGVNEDADNGDHKVSYTFPISKEFNFWLGNNVEPMDQQTFALMLEERVDEMCVADDEDRLIFNNLRPKFGDPLEILELSKNLVIYSDESVQQGGNLATGEREIKFSAVHSAKDKSGKPVTVPDFFMLRIPVFAGETPVKIPARLRYRRKGEGLVWFYDLYRVDQVFETAFDAALAVVKSQTGLSLFMGQASK